MYSFDPKKLDIRQMHNLMIGGIAPRPIALVSTQSASGQDNLAPFSFFNAFSSNPPVVAFSPARRGRDGTYKDTYKNLVETKECVVHVVTFDIVEQVNLTSTEYPTVVDEFIKSGLTKVASEVVKPFRVQESPFHLECRLRDMIALGDNNGSGQLAICDVIYVHIAENLYKDNKVVVEKMDQVGRNGGHYYTRAFGPSLFEAPQPQTKLGIGWDGLPNWLFELGLTKNQLALLAQVESLPDNVHQKPPSWSENQLSELQKKLQSRDIASAWQLLSTQ